MATESARRHKTINKCKHCRIFNEHLCCSPLISVSDRDRVEMKIIADWIWFTIRFYLIFFPVEMKSEKLAKCMYNVDGTVDDIY